ncbi:MAG: type II secretion system protein GspN [Pseudobdellovibrionaceae bacterium]
MKEALGKIFSFLSAAKKQIFIGILSVFAFIVILFPFNDLSDLVSTQVAQLTNNQVFVQFEDLKLSLLSGIGLELKGVYVEGTQIPTISADEIIVSPSVSGMIKQLPYGKITANGLLKGSAQVRVSGGTPTENNKPRTHVELDAENIALKSLREMITLPIPIDGKISTQSSFQIEPNFQEQPDGDVVLKIDNFELPPASVETQMGPLTLPDLKLKSLELKGRMYSGRFDVQEGKIGTPADELYGTVKGHLEVTYTPKEGTKFGGYNFDVDLKVKKSLHSRASLFLVLLDAYKTETPEGPQFKLKIAGSNFIEPPRFEPLRK